MPQPKDENANHVYLGHAHGLVHILRRGLLVVGYGGFYMGILVHGEDVKVATKNQIRTPPELW